MTPQEPPKSDSERPHHQTNGVELSRNESERPSLPRNLPPGRDELGRFAKGNRGRPFGAVGKRRTVLDLCDQHDFDPLEQKLLLCKELRQQLDRDAFDSDYARYECLRLFSDALKDVLQYGYPKQKAIEHLGQLEFVRKLQALETMTDDELRAVLAEAQEYARKIQP